jgi:hypothetical protein
MPRHILTLVVVSCVLLLGSIGLAVADLRAEDAFPWGIHLVTVPAVLLLGVIMGWGLRDRQLAEEAARRQLDEESQDSRDGK